MTIEICKCGHWARVHNFFVGCVDCLCMRGTWFALAWNWITRRSGR